MHTWSELGGRLWTSIHRPRVHHARTTATTSHLQPPISHPIVPKRATVSRKTPSSSSFPITTFAWRGLTLSLVTHPSSQPYTHNKALCEQNASATDTSFTRSALVKSVQCLTVMMTASSGVEVPPVLSMRSLSSRTLSVRPRRSRSACTVQVRHRRSQLPECGL